MSEIYGITFTDFFEVARFLNANPEARVWLEEHGPGEKYPHTVDWPVVGAHG